MVFFHPFTFRIRLFHYRCSFSSRSIHLVSDRAARATLSPFCRDHLIQPQSILMHVGSFSFDPFQHWLQL